MCNLDVIKNLFKLGKNYRPLRQLFFFCQACPGRACGRQPYVLQSPVFAPHYGKNLFFIFLFSAGAIKKDMPEKLSPER